MRKVYSKFFSEIMSIPLMSVLISFIHYRILSVTQNFSKRPYYKQNHQSLNNTWLSRKSNKITFCKSWIWSTSIYIHPIAHCLSRKRTSMRQDNLNYKLIQLLLKWWHISTCICIVDASYWVIHFTLT